MVEFRAASLRAALAITHCAFLACNKIISLCRQTAVKEDPCDQFAHSGRRPSARTSQRLIILMTFGPRPPAKSAAMPTALMLIGSYICLYRICLAISSPFNEAASWAGVGGWFGVLAGVAATLACWASVAAYGKIQCYFISGREE